MILTLELATAMFGLMRRPFSSLSKRRALFQFEALEYDDKVAVHSDSMGTVEIPLESHPIGTYSPSRIPFDEKLLEVLACPISGCELKFDRKRNILVSEAAGVAFPINNAGMPLFLKKWAIFLEDLKNK